MDYGISGAYKENSRDQETHRGDNLMPPHSSYSSLKRGFCPKYRVNAQLVHFVNENDDVMTEHLTKRFVDHRNIRLAPQVVSEFPFNHAESGLRIAALVVVLQKLIPFELEVMKHLFIGSTDSASGRSLQSNERGSASLYNRVDTFNSVIRFIPRDFRNLEVLSCGFNHRREERGITGELLSNFDSCHNIGLYAAGQMNFYPPVLCARLAIFQGIPTN